MNNLKITAGKMFSKEIVMKIIFFFNILCAPNQNDIENCDKNKLIDVNNYQFFYITNN